MEDTAKIFRMSLQDSYPDATNISTPSRHQDEKKWRLSHLKGRAALSGLEDSDETMISRISLQDLSGLVDSCFDEQTILISSQKHDEKKWRLSYLKNQFESFKLDTLYKTYTKKIDHGYFSLFLILQCILSLIHLIVVAVSNKNSIDEVFLDIILYSATLFLSGFGLCVVDRIAEKCHKLHYLSIGAFTTIFFINFFVPFYHGGSGRYKSAYSAHLVLSSYLFFGVQNLTIAFIMGMSVSVVDIVTLTLATYTDDFLWKKLISDAIFLAAMNGLGIYYRYMNEIVIRRSFLDRRDYIMSTHQLKHEEQQVENLMQSILPHYIINKVKEKYIKATKHFLKNRKVLRMNPFDNSLLDEHENVTILFADIVHYTEMTMKLDITGLLETLNELFGSFDDASEKLKVTRIKFLGDCYYCVSGLPPDVAPNPAEACVDLGLEMISTITKIRRQRNLDINMRIGVHSGKIISGIMGSVKYQFDIWSKDVDIANKMESEGCPGKVHITSITKNLLEKDYHMTLTEKGETVPLFKHKGIQTYLISPAIEPDAVLENHEHDIKPDQRIMPPRLLKFSKQQSLPNDVYLNQLQKSTSIAEEDGDGSHTQYLTIIEETNNMRAFYDRMDSTGEKIFKKRISNNLSLRTGLDARRSTNTIKRRTAFMNNTIKRYSERTEAVNKEMKEAINTISFSKYQQFVENMNVNIWLLFNKTDTELEYMKMPDPLFKYYLLCTLVSIACIYLLQNVSRERWSYTTWHFVAVFLLITLVFLPLSWTQFLFIKYIAKYSDEIPRNKLIYALYEASKKITNNFYIRLSIFSLIYFLLFMSFLIELIDCRSNYHVDVKKTNVTPLSTEFGPNFNCVIPWHTTETCLMSIITIFIFLRIFIWIKLFYGVLILAVFGYCVMKFMKSFYAVSETFNPSVEPQIAHIMSFVFLTLTLHLVDRQTDYMNRLAYLLNEKVKSEQEEAHELEYVNENLLLNILPKHVAKIYLDINREMQELYFEKHDNVAIMFASIITDDDLQDCLDDRQFIILMNKYITSFDTISNRREFQSIEKIKIAKWTYMVACGLFPGGKGYEVERHHTSSNLETLLGFATEMFKIVRKVNRNQQQQCKLRIGICHGPIVAGVVGSKKPLYDIWGDPVNMASRMDSTGKPNCIQVMESTAEVIGNLGYACNYRGKTYVKGRNELVDTYFVELTKEYNILRIKNE